MAYIPDEAILDSGEVSKTAFRLFCYLCKHGSMTNNRVTVGLDTASKFLGIAYENTTRLNKELKTKGWIKTVGSTTILVKGRTDKNISLGENELTKTSVLDVATDENISFEVVETDENVSCETVVETETDENISPKLTKTSVAYKEEPPFLNHPIKPKTERRVASNDSDVREVFEEWQRVLVHPNAKFDPKRRDRIRARMKEGWSVDELKTAIAGVTRSPYHLGDNKTGTRYDGIDTIFRDTAQVEKFIELAGNTNGKPKPSTSPKLSGRGDTAETLRRLGIS